MPAPDGADDVRSPRPDLSKSLPTAAGKLLVRIAAAGAAGRAMPETPSARLLADRGLVKRDMSGRLTLTDLGRARLCRDQASPDQRFRAQHLEIVHSQIEQDGAILEVEINQSESPLAWLRSHRDRNGRPILDAVAFAAGERFRADLTRAAMLPRMSVDWTAASRGPRPHGTAEFTESVLAARQRIARAQAAVGRDFAGLLVDVCGFLKGLAQVERERGWPSRSAKLVLQLALARLAEHYGWQAQAQGPKAAREMRSWHAAP